MQCVYALILSLAYLLRKRVCIHSRNVNTKYCIVITPVEQNLQPVGYAWLLKQHTMFTLCWPFRLPVVIVGYYLRILVFYVQCLNVAGVKIFSILCSVLNRGWGFTVRL